MALNLLAIPAMSSEVERVFSSTGLMLTDRRNRLKEDVIEAAECMKSWQADRWWTSWISGYRTGTDHVGTTGSERNGSGINCLGLNSAYYMVYVFCL